MMRKSQIDVFCREWAVDGLVIPIRVYSEPKRNNWRVSIASQSVIMRFPSREWHKASSTCLEWGQTWLKLQMIRSPHLFSRFKEKKYFSGKVIFTCFGYYELRLQDSAKSGSQSSIRHGLIILNLSNSMDATTRNRTVPMLISKALVNHHRQDFCELVSQINQETFQFRYNKIMLKYTHHMWGSCSFRRNLNFSTRLFMAPDPVIRYLIIHELAHLQYYDHSRRFWSLVRRAMPEYTIWNRWLREQGPMLQF